MRQRALGRYELNDAERKSGHRSKGVQRDRCGGIEQRLEGHVTTDPRGFFRTILAQIFPM
jgi:hypothetical protein